MLNKLQWVNVPEYNKQTISNLVCIRKKYCTIYADLESCADQTIQQAVIPSSSTWRGNFESASKFKQILVHA